MGMGAALTRIHANRKANIDETRSILNMITGGSWARDEIERPWTGSVFDRRSLGKFHDQTSWLLYDTGPGKLDGRITDQPQTEVHKRDARAHGSPCLLQTPSVIFQLLSLYTESRTRIWSMLLNMMLKVWVWMRILVTRFVDPDYEGHGLEGGSVSRR